MPAILAAGSVTVGTTAAPLTRTATTCTKVVVAADPANTGSIIVGNSAAQAVALSATAPALTLEAASPSLIWVKGSAAGQVCNWLVTG